MKNIINSIFLKNTATKEDLVKVLKDDNITQYLFEKANTIRSLYVGDTVYLRGLIEFSNICKRNCMYCGLRRDNLNIERYRLTEDEIISLGKKAASYGYQTLVLQSGEDSYYTMDKLSYIIKELKKLKVAVTLSIGEKTFEEYKILKEAGADRYLIRIETTDKKLYEELDPGMSHKERKNCLSYLKELNYEVGTGCLVGLPNQTLDSLAEDILFFKNIDADMIGVGPFIPSENTPLKNAIGGDLTLALKVMALTRLLLPKANIPATTAMETLNKEGRIIALKSGANVIMPNVTKCEYQKLYALYPGKTSIGNMPIQYANNISHKIKSINRKTDLKINSIEA